MVNPFFTDTELAEREHIRKLGMENVRYAIPWFVNRQHPVFIFGAGKTSELLAVPLLQGANILGVIDNNRALWGTKRFGVHVFSPDGALQRAANAIVVISVMTGMAEAVRQCRELGFETISLADCLAYSDQRRYREDLESLGAGAALDIWADKESRDVYCSCIRYHAGFQQSSLPLKAVGITYFQDFVPMSAYRHFVDAGAYGGDTYRDCLQYTTGGFDSYYMFEPFSGHQPVLEKIADADPRVTVINAAMAEAAGAITMRYSGNMLVVCDEGDIVVRKTALDDELADRKVTFVKMDIEGGELKALQGAKNIIRDQRPILAISAYHEPEHLWAIPLWIRDLNMGYALRLRHHYNLMPWDTVCYAVPQA